jgi:hypothetical protein
MGSQAPFVMIGQDDSFGYADKENEQKQQRYLPGTNEFSIFIQSGLEHLVW